MQTFYLLSSHYNASSRLIPAFILWYPLHLTVTTACSRVHVLRYTGMLRHVSSFDASTGRVVLHSCFCQLCVMQKAVANVISVEWGACQQCRNQLQQNVGMKSNRTLLNPPRE